MSISLNFSVSNFYPLTYLRGGKFISLMLEDLRTIYFEITNTGHNCSPNEIFETLVTTTA
jgi:hypothetical protein